MYKRSPPSLQCKQILPKRKQIHGHIYAPVINSLITHSIHDLRIFNSLKIHIFHNFVSHSCIIGFLATCRQRNELIKQCGHINLKRRDCKCVAIYTSSAHGVTLAFAWSVWAEGNRGVGWQVSVASPLMSDVFKITRTCDRGALCANLPGFLGSQNLLTWNETWLLLWLPAASRELAQSPGNEKQNMTEIFMWLGNMSSLAKTRTYYRSILFTMWMCYVGKIMKAFASHTKATET